MINYQSDITNRLSEAIEYYHIPQAEAWGLGTITGLRPVSLTI